MATKFKDSDFEYEVIDETKKEVKLKNGHLLKGSITIPEEVEYDGVTYTVTEIGEDAFGSKGDYAYAKITDIFIPDTVTKISAFAFYTCALLKEVSGAENVTIIDKSAFNSCFQLEDIAYPQVVNIGANAFKECQSLQDIVIPPSVKTIGKYAFLECSGLQELTIFPGVETIDDAAFESCISLIEITIPSTVKTIGSNAFAKRQKDMALECITICNDKGGVTVGENAFANDIDPHYIGTKDIIGVPTSAPVEVSDETEVVPTVEIDTTLPEPTYNNVELNIGTSEKIDLDDNMYVRDLATAFNKRFGSVLRIYEGRSRQGNDVKLSDIATKSIEGEIVWNGNDTVGGFIHNMEDKFGLKVKVYTCDEWVAVLDGLTLTASGQVKKGAVKADMRAMLLGGAVSDGAQENGQNVGTAKLTLNSNMTVEDLASAFNQRFGSVLRVYQGRSRQEGSVKLCTLTDKSLDGDISCDGNLTVNQFVSSMADVFGLKVKVYTCDEWVTVLDDLTLVASGKIKKNATRADMQLMLEM